MPTTNEIFTQKEKREIFRTVINSLIARLPEGKLPDIDKLIEMAKRVVDKAFEYYPSPEEENGEKVINLDFEK